MLPENNDYKNLVEEIKSKVRQAQYSAMVKVNGEMILLYWNIGKELNEQVQYGNSFIDTLAQEIRLDSPQVKGFSARNLRYMKRFAKEITDQNFLQTVSAKLTWSHNLVLLEKLKNMDERFWYGTKAIENAWSVDVLEFQIAGRLMERQTNPEKVQNFALRLPEPQSELAIETMKDPYIFDFVEIREGMIERDIENELIKHITNFLLEMGSGFAYMGHQKLFRVGEEEFFPDLLFYNTILHCYVVIELKMKKFIPEYAGKMNFYLSVVDEQLKTENDNPSIGLILCRDKNKVVAEYALKDMSKPIGVSEYRLTQELPEFFRKALPDSEEWEKHIRFPDEGENGKIAHINENSEQSIIEHLEGVAERASKYCKDYCFSDADVQAYAYQVGMAHDLGKYSDKFQQKIREAPDISVDHSTAGAREMQKMRMPSGAFAIAGHHGGIPNGSDFTNSNLMERIKNRVIEPYMDYKNEVELKGIADPGQGLPAYDFSFFVRMLFSSIVDADFLDTEKFMHNGEIDRGKYCTIDALYERIMRYIQPWLDKVDETSRLNQLRTDILRNSLKAGMGERGIFSLTVPTGGGKTVSSLSFALTHAKKNGMERIIYVIPYTSIIEQNIKVFRDILDEDQDNEQNVLAHYSNAILETDNEQHKLSIENWDAPIIVTTSVQFFESLHSNRVSQCRKLHNIANSVIIFDEVQMLPLNCLMPCVRAIQNLVRHYKVTALLCTATQPALDKWLKPMCVKEICPNYKELFQTLKRARIENLGRTDEDTLADYMKSAKQTLTIVNTKRSAQNLYGRLPEEGRYHLSTYMTPFDRKTALDEIRELLKDGRECRVVSTSLIEAGVDISFPMVFREIAGVDSIIQAAGRCNREGKGEYENSIVYVFGLQEMPSMLEKNIAITEETFQKYGKYDDLEAIHYYFSSLQSLDTELLDQYHVIDGFEKGIDGIQMPFKKIAETFHFIDSDTKMLIIPIEAEAQKLTTELQYRISNGDNFKDILRKLGVYSVNLYHDEYKSVLDDVYAYEVIEGVAVLQNLSLYTKEIGLHYEKSNGAIIV